VNDVTSSIDCLVALNIRQFPGVHGLVNRILPLAMKEANIKKTILSAFQKLYLNDKIQTVD
jgi:hypothetical protein